MIPYLYQVDSLSLTATEGNSLDISCWLLVGSESNPYQNLTWSWSIGGLSYLYKKIINALIPILDIVLNSFFRSVSFHF